MAMNILAPGTIKRLHVDRRIMQQNVKNKTSLPAYTIQTSKGSIKAVQVVGHFNFDQRMKPLSCGARMYGETRGKVMYV